MEFGHGDKKERFPDEKSNASKQQNSYLLDVRFRSYMDQIGKIVEHTVKPLQSSAGFASSKAIDATLTQGMADSIDWSSEGMVSPRSGVSSGPLSLVPDLVVTERNYGSRITSSRSVADEVEVPFDLRNVPDGTVDRNNVEKFLRRLDKLKVELKNASDRTNLLQKDKSFLAGRNEFLEKANHDLRAQLAAANSRISSLENNRENLLIDARKIHEKDRAHYLHSFQKVLKNMDTEKMQELNKTIRKQVRSYESQISDLREQNKLLAEEKHMFRKEAEDVRRKFDAAEIKLATGQSALSEEFAKLQVSMAGRTHGYEENKHKLRTALEAIVQLKEQITFMQDRNNIILRQYDSLKEETDAEITKLMRAVNEKDARLEILEKTSTNASAVISGGPVSTDSCKQKVVDDLQDELAEARKEIDDKTDLLQLAHEKIDQLKVTLQSEKEILNRVRKTRDQLYDVVRNDERYAQDRTDRSRLGQHRPGRNSHYRDDMKPYRYSNGGNKRYVERRGYGSRGNRRGYGGKKGGHPGRHGWDSGERFAGRGNSRQYNRGVHRGHNDRVDGRGQNYNVGHRDNRNTDRYHGRNNQRRTGHGQERQRNEQAGNGNMDGTRHRDGTPFEMMNEEAIDDNYSLE